ncbi:MAG: hypothetical protein ACR2PT_10870 [Endozoicomonas sp.]
MIPSCKKLFLAVSALVLSTMAGADDQFVHQLAGVDSQGHAVVIEHKTGDKGWDTVYQGHLDGCLMNEYSNFAHHHSLSTFHHQLDGKRFAFGCSNGFVFIGTPDQRAAQILSPSPDLGKIGSWYNSPIYLAYSEAFNRQHGKNWLFAAQHGHLFIIDIAEGVLVNIEGWKAGNYLSMGDGRPGIDHTKPMTGLDIYQDTEGTFHIIGVMERNLTKKESHYSRALMQSVALPDGVPVDRWVDFKEEAINSDGDGILQYADNGFTTAATGVKPEPETSFRGDFSALNIDPYTRAMVLRGHHHNLVVVRYPVNQPVSLHHVGLWGQAVSSKIASGQEPKLLNDGYPKTFRVKSGIDASVLRPASKDNEKRRAVYHMLSMKKGVIFSAEADFEGLGQYVSQCDTGLSSGAAWEKQAWVKPKECDWTRATPNILRPNEIKDLKHPMPGLEYYHSFTTRVIEPAMTPKDEL